MKIKLLRISVKFGIVFLVLLNATFVFSGDLSYEEEKGSQTLLISLADVTELVLNNNFDVKIAKLEALISATGLEKSRSVFDTILTLEAGYSEDELDKGTTILGERATSADYNIGLEKKLPTGTTVELDLSDERSFSDSAFITINPSHDANVGISVTQELGKNTFGLVDRGTIAMVRLAIENTDSLTLDKIENSIGEAQKAYWLLVLAKENVALKEKMFKEAGRLYEINKDKLDMGTIEKSDFLASEANLTLRETELLIVRNELKDASESLKLMLNLKSDLPLEPVGGLGFQPYSISFVQAVKDAVCFRRDYARAKNEIEKQNINLKLKKNSLWPQIDLTATWQRNGLDRNFSQALEKITEEDNHSYYVGLEFEVPLENRSARSLYRKADLEKAKALLNFKKIEKEIAVDIDERVRKVALTKNTYLNNMKTAELQKEKLKAEDELFYIGRSSSYFVINYQEDVLLAEFNVLKSLYDYRIALLDLKLAQDSLLNELGIEEE